MARDPAYRAHLHAAGLRAPRCGRGPLLGREARGGWAAPPGAPPTPPPDVRSPETRRIPAGLGGEVDQLIEAAIRQRPDPAPQVAPLDARRADVARAKAEFYPTV